MAVGKQVRLNRLFSHPSGRLCSVAVDHFVAYGDQKIPDGLRHIRDTVAAVVRGGPDALTMHRGVAAATADLFAGKVPLILQSTAARPDDSCHVQLAGPEDAVRMGADALAVTGFARGATEGKYLRVVSECVRAADRVEIPVVNHMYPRTFEGGCAQISFDPDDVAWAVRCAMECGADVIKTPYCNDVEAFRQIVSETPVPVVAAGGPKKDSFEDVLAQMRDVVQSGAWGITVGRNVWGRADITEALLAIKAVVHDEKSPEEASRSAD